MAKRTAKPAPRKPRKAAARAKAGKKPAVRKVKATRARPAEKIEPLDLSAFPPESVVTLEKWFCLACIADVFTRHLGLSPRAAYLEIKRYTPPLAELQASVDTRPWFSHQPLQKACPYCGSPAKWHARLWIYRIESGKATDAPRRALVKSLPQDDQFVVLEEKATQQEAFFEWLEKIGKDLDLDDPAWLGEVTMHYLSRKEPKTDWRAAFDQAGSIRRSRRLESGWELDGGRLFLAPLLFDELLLVQYLISRSHRAGGLTLEGRYTLPELIARLRNSGYLRAVSVSAQSPSDVLEQLVSYLGGGESPVRFYHILDRRDLLNKVKDLKLTTPPKPKRR
jgi:hypothetical protein